MHHSAKMCKKIKVLQNPEAKASTAMVSTRRVNTLRPRQNGRHFADDIFKCIFLNENVWIAIRISLKFVPKVLINNITSLVQIMAWRRPGNKPFSEPMMIHLRTHICVTRPQWVKMRYSVNEMMLYWYCIPNIVALLIFQRHVCFGFGYFCSY